MNLAIRSRPLLACLLCLATVATALSAPPDTLSEIRPVLPTIEPSRQPRRIDGQHRLVSLRYAGATEGVDHFSASLLAGSGYAYFLADDGTMTMVRPGGTEPDVAAVNKLGELCIASPAISQHCLFIRGQKNLYCIGTARAGGD